MRVTPLVVSIVAGCGPGKILSNAPAGWDDGRKDEGVLLPEEVDPEEAPPPEGTTDQEGNRVFHVWAPFATAVHVVGSFNGWSEERDALEAQDGGHWTGSIPDAQVGDEYKILIHALDGAGRPVTLWRNDSRNRQVRSSNGNSVVAELPAPGGAQAGGAFNGPRPEETVIYEMHVGTFKDDPGGSPGNFDTAIGGLDELAELGVNTVELMPVAEFVGDSSWGYNPAHPYAVETAYGGPLALKRFVDAAHQRGLAVLIDVVYNHFGPSDLSLWRFDGWSQNGGGGIYFYNDERARTPWGDTRPDYGRSEVRRYIYDNARMWLDEYGADGLRWDSTVNIRTHDGIEIPDGWAVMQRAIRTIKARFPQSLIVAEDLQNNDWITRRVDDGGAGFDAQWDAGFVHPIRDAIITREDRDRSMAAVREAITHGAGGNPFARVIYTESHDEVANGHARVPEEIWPGHADSWYARKRSTLGAALVLTSPGIPFLFQGQEVLEDGYFRDTVPVDWSKRERFSGIRSLYRDLIRLRRNVDGHTRGLLGSSINPYHTNESAKVLAFHRWDRGGAGDDVVVVVNMSAQSFPRYSLGFPRPGRWRLRFDSDRTTYSSDFGALAGRDVEASDGGKDGLSVSGDVVIGPYTAQVFSQD